MREITPETSRLLIAAATKVSQLRKGLRKAEKELDAVIERARKECAEVKE